MRLQVTTLALALMLMQACSSEEYEKKITEPEVPAAVLQAFKSAYPNAEVRGYTEEAEGGKKLYEISFTNEGKRIDAAYASDGKLLELEETIANEDLPAAALQELQKQFNAFELKRVEKVLKGERLLYEAKVDVTRDGATTRHELVFAEDGKLLKQKVEREDDDE